MAHGHVRIGQSHQFHFFFRLVQLAKLMRELLVYAGSPSAIGSIRRVTLQPMTWAHGIGMSRESIRFTMDGDEAPVSRSRVKEVDGHPPVCHHRRIPSILHPMNQMRPLLHHSQHRLHRHPTRRASKLELLSDAMALENIRNVSKGTTLDWFMKPLPLLIKAEAAHITVPSPLPHDLHGSILGHQQPRSQEAQPSFA